MKKLVVCLFIISTLAACEGDRGPQGPPGNPGANIVGQTFELENVNFAYEPQNNLYSVLIDIPNDIEVFNSDAILVYRLETVPGTNGPIDTYSLIPQNYFLSNGTIQYVYNHSINDVELLITGNFNLSNLSFGFIQNQIFRFVVVPSDFANNPNVNIQTFADLENSGIEMKMLN